MFVPLNVNVFCLDSLQSWMCDQNIKKNSGFFNEYIKYIFIYSQWRIECHYSISFSMIPWSLFLGRSRTFRTREWNWTLWHCFFKAHVNILLLSNSRGFFLGGGMFLKLYVQFSNNSCLSFKSKDYCNLLYLTAKMNLCVLRNYHFGLTQTFGYKHILWQFKRKVLKLSSMGKYM